MRFSRRMARLHNRIVPADGLVDIGAALVAHYEAAYAVEPLAGVNPFAGDAGAIF